MKDGDKRKGNQFWKEIKPEDIGRNPNFETPQDLWEKSQPYFIECDNNPITKTETTISEKKNFVKEYEYKIPYTWEGLYVFLGVTTLDQYKEKKAFLAIITHIGNIIYNQKFTGAAAGLFNSNIIARDLGLRDRQEIDHKVDIKQITGMTLDDSGD